jgi:hypothetical protein
MELTPAVVRELPRGESRFAVEDLRAAAEEID